MIEKISISKSHSPCSDNPNYSFTECVFNYIARSAGCQIHWIYTHMTVKFPECETREQFNDYDRNLAILDSMSGFGIANMTECPIRCRVQQYSFSECKSELVTWKHDWSSSFYLGAEMTEVRREEEFWVFDASDTLNGIGGALGLFLGVSFLMIWDILEFLLKLGIKSKPNLH